jgi:hypothetical protein
MKRLLPLTLAVALAMVVALVQSAGAQNGVRIQWNDCNAANTNANNACDSNAGEQFMIVTGQVAAPITDLQAVQGVIDLISSTATLPDWWKVQNAFRRPGTLCRNGQLSVQLNPGSIATAGSCVNDAWNGNGSIASGNVDFLHPFPYNAVGGPNGTGNPAADSLRWARFKFISAIAPGNDLALVADTEYFLFALRIGNGRTVTPGTVCAGCADPVCIVLNQVDLLSPVSGITTITNAIGSGSASSITWQGGAGANCATVPVRNTTWGQIKSFYR